MTDLQPLDWIFAETILKKAGLQDENTALVLAKLMHGSRAGHLCLTQEHLGSTIGTLPSSIMEEGIDLFPKAPIVVSKGRYYLQKNWVYETYILQHLQRLRTHLLPSYFDRSAFYAYLSQCANKLLPTQLSAIRTALKQSLTLIFGGPGTGKTYTATHLVKALFSSLKRDEKKDFNVSVAAPTGKAASNLLSALQMQEATDPALHIEASTLHKLLKLQPNGNRLFLSGKIDADLIIIDEASMIDVPLLAHLLEAVGEDTPLVLIGDPDQLPPIDAGSLFPEISLLFGVQLDQCMRTEENFLQQLAQAVKQGDSDAFFQLLPSNIEPLSVEQILEKISPVLSYAPPDPKQCLEKYKTFRILNAIRQGPQGADVLNEQILETLQKKDRWWAAPILATVNDSFADIYNGMSGVLIGQTFQDAAAYFDDPSSGKIRRYSPPPPYELAFCISIHKSQGSEFDEVLGIFPNGSENFGREALYTALTRAKKKIEFRGEREILQKMIASTSRIFSGLTARITEI